MTGLRLSLWGTLLLAVAAPAQQPPVVVSTAADRTAVAVAVYSSGRALVSETRRVELAGGRMRLGLADVLPTLEPETVQPVLPAEGVRLLEQMFLNDVASPQTLLEHSVGKTLTLELAAAGGGTRTVRAVLLSPQGPIWQIGDEIVTGLHPEAIRLPAVPGELVLRPTLRWTLETAKAGPATLGLSYFAGGLSWRADYALVVSADGTRGTLRGWATVRNDTDAALGQAQLALVAGEPHRATGPRPPGPPRMQAMVAGAALPAETVGELHLYRLPAPVNLPAHSTLQVTLLDAPGLDLEPSYVLEGNTAVFRMSIPAGQPTPQPVHYYLSFRNQPPAGVPLPAGTVRVFTADGRGQLTWLGEDTIPHTPAGETVRLLVGDAFDLVAERTQTDFRRLGERVYESAFAITLRNHRDRAVTIEVREPVGGSWEVVDSSLTPHRLDAFTLGFSVPVPAGGATTLRYRIRVTD